MSLDAAKRGLDADRSVCIKSYECIVFKKYGNLFIQIIANKVILEIS